MPSFDIVSEVNQQEIDNAINQVMQEISTRFDFKGSRSKVVKDKEGVNLLADDDFKMKAVIDMLKSKLIKRGVELKAVEFGKVEPGPDGLTKCQAKIVSGIDQEKAKDLVKLIKGTQIKVQAAIQGDNVRVSGKKRDDLQAIISHLRTCDFPIPLQFLNFRD